MSPPDNSGKSQQPEHFDVVVVGSGFGGSVMAHQLAQAGLRVCVLERGKAYPPGTFPRSPATMKTNFWDPSEGRHGLFDVWSFDGIDVLVSSGLGGGSLIYANVLLRKDENWFVREDGEHWPLQRRDLDPHYDAVEKLIGANPLPPHLRQSTTKAREYAEAAGRAGLDHHWLPLAVSFPGGRSGRGRAHRRAGPQPVRAHPQHLPHVRRVRHRVQLRQQEHAGPDGAVGGRARRGRGAHPLPGVQHPARWPRAGTGWSTSCTSRSARASAPTPRT